MTPGQRGSKERTANLLDDHVLLFVQGSAGLGLVAGRQTFLLAGAAVLKVKNRSAAKQFEAVLHVRFFQFTNTKSEPLRSSDGVAWECCGMVEKFRRAPQVNDTFTDSWRFFYSFFT